MQFRICFTLPFGYTLLCGLFPAAGQEAAVLDDRLWSPTPRMELVDPPAASDKLWIDHTTLLKGTSIGGSQPGFSVQYNFGKPWEVNLMEADGEYPNSRRVRGVSVEKNDAKPDPSDPAKINDSSSDPSKLYLRGHLVMKDGLQLERSGKFGEALEKLREAKKQFDATYEADPKWNVEIVEYRRRKIGEDIRRLEQLASGQPKPFRARGSDKNTRDPHPSEFRLPDEPQIGRAHV